MRISLTYLSAWECSIHDQILVRLRGRVSHRGIRGIFLLTHGGKSPQVAGHLSLSFLTRSPSPLYTFVPAFLHFFSSLFFVFVFSRGHESTLELVSPFFSTFLLLRFLFCYFLILTRVLSFSFPSTGILSCYNPPGVISTTPSR